MQLTTHGNTHFKGATKNLSQELKKQGFEITHSNALNIAAIMLGYKNYNTYKALNENEDFGMTSLSEIRESVQENLGLLYPSIKDRFTIFPNVKSDRLNTFVYKEENEEEWLYYLLVEVKNNITGRVFYSPRYDSILLFVYPNIKEGLNEYEISLDGIDSKQLHQNYFSTILHLLRTKVWATSDLLTDIMELMNDLVISRDKILKLNNNTKEDGLKVVFENHSDETLVSDMRT